jgi:hypothetical protein
VRAKLTANELEDLLQRVKNILSPRYFPKWEYDEIPDEYRPRRGRVRPRSPEGN